MSRRRHQAASVAAAICLVLSTVSTKLAVAQETITGIAGRGNSSEWNGFTKTDFKVSGRKCFVVSPKQAAVGKPWIWRARFPNFHSEVDQLLLADGYHVAFIDTNGMLGSPEALPIWEAFYHEMTDGLGLNRKVVLEGVSRGGLFVYRWAKHHPATVACMYNDTPVCDFKSWPGGQGDGLGDTNTWKSLLREYQFESEQEANDYRDNPIDGLEPIATAQIPIMHIVTENDQVVPPKENTYVLRERLHELGHRIFYVVSLEEGERLKGHHFDLDYPSIGYHFIRKYSNDSNETPVYLRSGLDNSRHVFEKTKRGRVAFLGGSITEMNGWRGLVMESLQKRFPGTNFDFVDAGIASTDSTLGAFRLNRDVFARGQVDLLFIESAVNELHNRRSPTEVQRAVEGIIRAARQKNPNIDLVAQYFYDMPFVDQYRQGKVPPQIAALERVAIQYGVNAIDQAKRTTDLFDSKTISVAEFGGCHPKPAGHAEYAKMINLLFDRAWEGDVAQTLTPHEMPWPIDRFAYVSGRFVSPGDASESSGWRRVEQWQPEAGNARKHDVGQTFWVADQPGAELKFPFRGTAIGIFVVAGPDVGVLEWQIDGQPPKRLDQFTRWSKGLHIPWIYMLETELHDEPHQLTLRIAESKHPNSKGHASRIRFFAVNGGDENAN
ncbi:MAG: GDSL-type esterase/lipase family protein [Aureliella sp.]